MFARIISKSRKGRIVEKRLPVYHAGITDSLRSGLVEKESLNELSSENE
jgi:hypothetical protein